jgi:hypothetical protein
VLLEAVLAGAAAVVGAVVGVFIACLHQVRGDW